MYPFVITDRRPALLASYPVKSMSKPRYEMPSYLMTEPTVRGHVVAHPRQDFHCVTKCTALRLICVERVQLDGHCGLSRHTKWDHQGPVWTPCSILFQNHRLFLALRCTAKCSYYQKIATASRNPRSSVWSFLLSAEQEPYFPS